MSHGWDLYCETHRDPLHDDGWWNRGEAELLKLWARREEIAPLVERLALLGVDVDELHWESNYEKLPRHHLRWLIAHTSCNVVLLDEYGARKSTFGFVLPPQHCPTCSCATVPL